MGSAQVRRLIAPPILRIVISGRGPNGQKPKWDYWSIAAVVLRQPCEPSRRVIVVATGLVWIAARSIGVAASTRFHLPQLPAGVSSLVSVASTVMPSRVTPSNLYLFVPILVSFGIVTPAGVAAVPHAPS